MKKVLLAFFVAVFGLVWASCTPAKEENDPSLEDRVTALEIQMSILNQLATELNAQAKGVAATVEQWQKEGYVVKIEKVDDGYTVTYLNGTTVTISLKGDKGDPGDPGSQGEAGNSPAVSIVMIDGVLYWAVDGKPLEVDGKKVPAIYVPVFSINEEGELIATVNGKETNLGKVVGTSISSLISDIKDEGDCVRFILQDGQEFSIAKAQSFRLDVENVSIEGEEGKDIEIKYTLTGANASTKVEAQGSAGYEVSVNMDAKVVNVKTPVPFVAGSVLIWASNDDGLNSIVKVTITEPAKIEVLPVDEIAAEGAQELEVNVTSNVEFTVDISEDIDWIHYVETKASKACTIVLKIDENPSEEPRSGEVRLLRLTGELVQTITIVQKGAILTTERTDILNNALTGVEGTTYANWTASGPASGVAYAGNSAGDAATIQLRSDVKNEMHAGIVSTSTYGLVKKVKVTWNAKTSATRYLEVYGKNTPYSATSELYANNTRGTLLGILAYTSADAPTAELELDQDFAYIGIRSRKSAQYLDEIAITWDEGTPAAPEVPSYDWDFGSEAWQSTFAGYGSAGTDITGWFIRQDGLQIVSFADKSKYQTTCFQMGGKATLVDNVVVERYFAFDAPSDGYVLVRVSNTGEDPDESRIVNVDDGNVQAVPGGFSCSAPEDLVFPVKAGKVHIYPTGNGLRFYRILFSVEDPTPAKELTIERLWGKYPTEWPSFTGNADRCVTTDGEYVYVAKAGAGKKGIWAISIADPTQVKEVCMDGVADEGTFYTSCVRNIYNPDTGKYILLLCNLAMEAYQHLYVYAYENGIDAAPTKLLYDYTIPDWASRRFGDFFTVVGDWKNGYLWFRTNTSGASTTARFSIVDGRLKSQTPDGFNYGYGASQGKGSFYQYSMDAKYGFLVTDSIGMFYDLNSAEGQAWNAPATTENMRRMFGVTPFEFNGEKYIAYTKMKDDNAARSWFRIIKDKGTAADFKASLEANEIVYHATLQIDKEGEESTEVMPGATYSDQTSASCAVAVLDDAVIMVGHHHNVGLSVFKMYMK